MRSSVFHKLSAVAWVVLGLISYPLGWANSVALVWAASAYANAKTDWAAADASKTQEILDRLERIEGRACGCHCQCTKA